MHLQFCTQSCRQHAHGRRCRTYGCTWRPYAYSAFGRARAARRGREGKPDAPCMPPDAHSTKCPVVPHFFRRVGTKFVPCSFGRLEQIASSVLRSEPGMECLGFVQPWPGTMVPTMVLLAFERWSQPWLYGAHLLLNGMFDTRFRSRVNVNVCVRTCTFKRFREIFRNESWMCI